MFIRLQLEKKSALFNTTRILRILVVPNEIGSIDYEKGYRSNVIMDNGTIRVRDTLEEIEVQING